MKTTLFVTLLTLIPAVAGCASDADRTERRDVRGNYASTAHYNAMERDEFIAAMEAGLRDFDARMETLKQQATALGPDALDEYHGALDELMEERRAFEAEFTRHRAMLAEEWRDEREDVAEQYLALREDLDEVYEEVVEEA
jgi:hypothetical protein